MTTVRPLVHTGDSANIAFYAERGRPPGYRYAEVLRSDHTSRGGTLVPAPPRFYITVRRPGEGKIAETTYVPKSRAAPGPLPARTVTRIVRKLLEERHDS